MVRRTLPRPCARWVAAACALLLAGSASAAPPADYLQGVKPILAAHCYSCHGAVRHKGGLRLDTAALARKGGRSGPAIVPGHANDSELIQRVTGAGGARRMPPAKDGAPLSDAEVATLRAWIDQGAPAPSEKTPDDPRRHWAFQPPVRPSLPRGPDLGLTPNPIDAFLADARHRRGLRASPPADRDTLLRRVYLDLVGLPPTREELHAFRADEAPDAYERVVDRLLASPAYGERWGRHWMDVWRYSDWFGLGTEVRFSHPHIWHWRDWIVESLNADKGYDRMVEEMLAGDELAPDDPATLRATGFLVRPWEIFNRNVWLDATIEHTAKAFLGLTMQCARCHDHKYDPITQQEYYRFRAFFEPYHVRIDRVPGQPDPAKAGLPRVFDDFIGTPTYLFVRGDENHPDKRHALEPGAPAAVGGSELAITPVALPVAAYCPDKRPFVIRETLAAGEQAVAQARTAVAAARREQARATQALAAAVAADRQAHARLLAARGKAPPAPAVAAAGQGQAAAVEERRIPLPPQAQAVARAAAEALARARLAADVAPARLARAASALAVAEAKQAALVAVLQAERAEDAAGKSSAAWQQAARAACAAQRRLAVIEAEDNQEAARDAVTRAQRALDGLTAAAGPKDMALQAALQKAAVELVQARSRLATADEQRARAETAALAPRTTAYTPRPLSFPRAKITFRDTPSTAPYSKFSTGRRLALARWIADRRNPLAARVAVNHIWARHFGEPLVGSMFDFGLRTKRPVHAELLDWLAVEFMESGWSMKHLHWLIVTSQAYRMRSSANGADDPNARLDPDNVYLWRMNTRRMEGEVIRDSLLALAGRLDPEMGGPDLPVATAEAGTRRTIYYRYARDDRIRLLTMFDAPNVQECYRRHETIVPQQALVLINSKETLTRAAQVAAVITREVGAADTPAAAAAFVDSAFERILGRSPTAAERAECVAGLAELTRAFAADRRGGAAHQRARADLVHVLLNHNDFVTVR